MPTTTTTYSFNKPVVGADEDDWGGYLNGNWDSVDDLLDGTTPVTGIDINSGTLDGVTIGGTTAGAGTFTNLTATGTTTLAGASTSADITFGDSDKAIFGAGSDLQIYHDGSHSYISDAGTGQLRLRSAAAMVLQNADGSKGYATFNDGGSSQIYYNGSEKLATTSTGIDVTGTVTADGVSVDGDITINDASPTLSLYDTDGTNQLGRVYQSGANLVLNSRDNISYGAINLVASNGSQTNNRLTINADGDISFYEDTGTTAQFFWDASEEQVNITNGTSDTALLITKGNDFGNALEISNSGASRSLDINHNADGTGTVDDVVRIKDNGTVKFIIDENYNVGIGTSSPSYAIHTKSSSGGVGLIESTSSNSDLYFKDSGTTYNYSNGIGSIGNALRFRSGDGTERMRIDSSGNVGIGTSSPSDNLDVASTAPTLRLTDTDGYYAQIYAGSGSLVFRTDVGQATAGDTMQFVLSGSEAMRIDSSGNVGIGTTSPAVLSHVAAGYTAPTGGLDAGIRSLVSSTGYTGLGILSASNASTYIHFGDPDDSDVGGIIYNHSSNHMQFNVNASERMRLDSSGNLLVGQTTQSPNTVGASLNANGNITAMRDSGIVALFNRGTSDGTIVEFRKDGTTVGSIGTAAGDLSIGSDDAFLFFDGGANKIVPASTSVGGASNGLLDLGASDRRFKDLYLSGGVLQSDGGKSVFGGGGSIDTLVAVSVQGATDADAMEIKVRTNGKNAIEFRNASNATVGKITVNASSTTYATTSDYRLKTDVQAVTNATDRLKQLNPVNFEWIADGTRVDGFLAHEAQAVVPEAVTGAKDAMRDEEYEVTPAVLDDDGNVVTKAVMGTRSVPDYQGIDQSKLVPLLVATIKELEARITALEAN